jgi:hypothetical protein
MQFGTRVKLTNKAILKEIEKIADDDQDVDTKVLWIVYVACLHNLEGVIAGLWPETDVEAPPGILEIVWDTSDPEWREYLNKRDEETGYRPYGWFEDELEVIE